MTPPEAREALPNMFNGMRVIEAVSLTVAGQPYEARRSWRERLFSRPWRPLQATRTVVPQVPYSGVIQISATTLMMHPETLRQLRNQLNGY